jgi:hypothetical protein
MTEPITTADDPAAILRIPAGAGGRAPLWAVLAFTFLGSLGTGIVTVGLFFIASNAYAFGRAESFLLGLAEGLVYVAGALGAGPALRVLRRRFPGLTTQRALGGLSIALGALCLIPLVIGIPQDPRAAAHWPVWVLMVCYSPLTGAMWPIVESYVSGGRSGATLRSALGRFNITWSVAVVVGLVAIGPLVKEYPAQLIASLGLVHVGALALVWRMGREPGKHLEEHHEAAPLIYTQLLTTFRILLPVTYLVMMALTPYLPRLLVSVGVDIGWQAPLAATWTAARVVCFLLLERWHGWHGRWYPAVAGMALLLGGFGMAVLAPLAGSGGPALALVIGGLSAFGLGMATIYTGALYYALTVGQAEVEAGGTHEALIGVGYTVGPACGLLALALVEARGVPKDGAFEVAMLVLVGVIALAAAGVAGWRSWKIARG